MKYQKLEHFQKEKMIYCQYVSYDLLQKKIKKKTNKETFYDSWRVEPTTDEVYTLWQKMTNIM